MLTLSALCGESLKIDRSHISVAHGTYVVRKMRQKELQNIDVSATVTLISSIYGSDFDGEAAVVFE